MGMNWTEKRKKGEKRETEPYQNHFIHIYRIKTTFMCLRSIAGVSLGRALPGYPVTVPLVCVPDILGGSTVWRCNKPKTKNQKPPLPSYPRDNVVYWKTNRKIKNDLQSTLLLRTTWMRSCCNWSASGVAAWQTQHPKTTFHSLLLRSRLVVLLPISSASPCLFLVQTQTRTKHLYPLQLHI